MIAVTLAVALVGTLQAQTYTLDGTDTSAKSTAAGKAQPHSAAPAQNSSNPLGWGSNIQNARLARAAELALQHGDHALAMDYAERAAQASPSDAQLWFLLGYTARLNAKYRRSEDAYTRGLRLSPSAVEGLSGLAQTYSVTGQTDKAEALLQQVLSIAPNRADDALLMGDLHMRAGDYTGALDFLHQAERVQSSARAELLLAITYEHLNQLDTASHYLNMAKHRDPNNPDVQRSLAGYYREVGKYSQAIAALETIQNPKPDVIAELAYTYQLDGKPDQSAKLYAQAAHARPKDLGLQLSAAQAEIAVGSIQQANGFLTQAATLDPEYYRLHAIRGEIAQMEERNRDAATEYSAAIDHLPPTPAEGPLYGIQLHMDLMQLEMSLNHKATAQQQLQIAQTEIGALHEHGADRAPFLRLRALIKLNAGDVGGAQKDAMEAISINPQDPNNLQLGGDVLMKLGRTEDAIATYKKVLAIDPKNRFALISLGYASRTAGRDADAEKYFMRLAQADPTLYIPYLAMGDMYTAHHQYTKAEGAYKKAYALAPKNALVVAGGMNASIEEHRLNRAGVWLSRADAEMRQEPQMLREQERYLSFMGHYQQSAAVGRQAIQVLPMDRDVVVYLGYDLFHLEQYDELLQLTSKYDQVFPREPDIPLLEGYVHKRNGQLHEALADFTEALKRDPEVVTAYVNRGYVLNDLHQHAAAAADFEAAIKRDQKNSEAHLGLAFASLDMNQPQMAVKQTQLVERESGDSKLIHTIRATAYGREGLLSKAAAEYRDALKFSPHDGVLYLGLGNTYFAERRYHEAIDQLLIAQKLSPRDAQIDALLARSYAHLHDRTETLKYIALAEKQAEAGTPAVTAAPADETAAAGAAGAASSGGMDAASNADSGDVVDPQSLLSDIYVSTGKAFTTLGDQKEAMQHFQKALIASDRNRVTVRMAIAQLMAQQNHPEDAQRQIALAQMEAEAGETRPPSGSQLIQAADMFRQMHEYELSQDYLERARKAGAPDISVRIGLANNDLATGNTSAARAELSAVSHEASSENDYQYLVTEANIYQQEHQGAEALTAFAQAADVAGEDQSAEQNLLQAGADEGYRVNQHLSLLGDFIVQPLFEDTTVYVLDSKLDGPTPVPKHDIALLPPPRSSLETQGTLAYHLHFGKLPTASGFIQVNNTNGTISVPQISAIQNRNTIDTSLNFGIDPTIHLGRNVLTFNAGIQGTIRRDTISPVALNQNLFREFIYMSTSSFLNAISGDGYFIRETGPFTESNLHSDSTSGAVNFRVGQPWGRTALVVGWGASDQKFTPVSIENYYTSTYLGLTHHFGTKLNIQVIGEDLRAWRVVGPSSGISQAIRPAGTIDYMPTRNWNVEASSSYASTRGFHVYDATQNGISVAYTRPFARPFNDKSGKVNLKYPIRFAAGVQEETFFNFSLGQNQTFRPYVSITIF